ncbi:alpha-amylase family glycosyl hydrolase [Microbacterium esteraromaticum]|uniref:alpha-amylase family glycosyl hydrolase n=1 Tax=Microbacterium esteraromaticum TaxID=57043 RepID=UPI00195869AA|nr:trehalose synthase [Microbacterium esteraromaticum]
MNPADTSDLWWRTAVIYCLDVETFQDSDGDGHGDFAGLTRRIDDLDALGVTCIWLMPFQPTPERDDGYDISDFYSVDPRFGDLGRVVEAIRVAHDRGIRVVIDLVINHTSDRHPWFVSARRSRTSPFRDYYVWRDKPPRKKEQLVFPGEETSMWEYDERTEQYFRHSFYRHQPDLNFANPDVRAEVARIIGFWLKLGVDGFRVDAVPFLITGEGIADEQDPHSFLRELRRFVSRREASAMLLGEVGLSHEEQLDYFGDDGTELDLQFDFLTTAKLFLALSRQQATPLAEVLAARPTVDARYGWAIFLRHHDELNLGLLDDAEMQEVFDTFAPEPDQRIYGRGIVRRLAPMLESDPRRLRLAYSLLFSLPGAPMIFYGEEIGMGELSTDLGRGAVRGPMQWDAGPLGGFTTSKPSKLRRPVAGGAYAPAHVNVHDQRRDPNSLWSFVALLADRYRSTPEIAWGEVRVQDAGDPRVLVHQATYGDVTFVAVHNFSAEPVTAHLEPLAEGCTATVLLEHSGSAPQSDHTEQLLDGYGFRWFRVSPDAGSVA